MATVTIELPTLLHRFADDKPEVTVEGDSVLSALEALFRQHPALRVHLIDESGRLREHVLCFHNGTNTRWSNRTDPALADGDRLTIMQAVSGG